MSQFDLRSHRLLLRPLLDSDQEDLRSRIFAFSDCVRTLIGDGSTAAKQQELVDGWYESYASTWKKYGYGMWGVFRREEFGDLPAGLMGIVWLENMENEPLKRVDLGYALTPDAWGKGVITEAASKVVEYAFEIVRVDCVEALIFSNINQGSVRVFEKLGGVCTGTEPAAEYIGEEWMGYTREFDLWLIQTVHQNRLKDQLHDACFRIGMFAVESDGDDKSKSLIDIEEALKTNSNLVDSTHALETARKAFKSGFSNPGWERYRIYNSNPSSANPD